MIQEYNGCLDCVARHPLVLILVGRRLNEESIFALRRPHPLNSLLQTPAGPRAVNLGGKNGLGDTDGGIKVGKLHSGAKVGSGATEMFVVGFSAER